MYFIALLLTLRLAENAGTPLDMEPWDLARAIANRLQQEVDHPSPQGITAALLESDGRHARIRVSLCGSDAARLTAGLQALAARSPLRLDRHHYEVESIDLAHPTWSRANTWADIAHASPARLMRFSFATPLITSRTASPGPLGALPFPEPAALFSSLIGRWQELGGTELPADAARLVRATDCVISHYRLRTWPAPVTEHPRTGYLGWIEYECRLPDHPYLASLNSLARLAFFTGTGYHTAQGMGTTAVHLRT